MNTRGDKFNEAYQKGYRWGRSGKPGHGWCHYDSYLEPELVEEWWAGWEAGTAEHHLAGGHRHSES